MCTKYDYDPETYDHSDVGSRPIVLFHNYTKNRIPFLTVIWRWDETCNYLLSSKYDPLQIGSVEIRLEDAAENSQRGPKESSPTKRTKKRKKELLDISTDDATNLSSMLSTFVKTCESINYSTVDSSTAATTSHKSISECSHWGPTTWWTIQVNCSTYDASWFLKEFRICDDDKKHKLVSQCEGIFEIINGRTSSSNNVSKYYYSKNIPFHTCTSLFNLSIGYIISSISAGAC